MGKHTHRCHNLRKRCGCPWRQWAKCPHPWHFFLKWRGREYRFQLNDAAGKPSDYVMGRTEAESLRDAYCSQIRAGTLAGQQRELSSASTSVPVTFSNLADLYLEQHVRIPTRRPASRSLMEWYVGALKCVEIPCAGGPTMALADKRIAEIAKSDVEAIRRIWRSHLPRAKGGEVGCNRLLSRLRHMFNWAIAEGYCDSTPFKRNGVTVVKLNSSAESPRCRRLEAGEEEKLLANATPLMKALIIAALETGCRLGELLSLQWGQVRWEENVILLPASKTKTGEARAIPMTARLKLMLEGRKQDPTGKAFGPEAYVFGNEVGEPVRSIRKAWEECRDRAGIVGLHFHDLRREFASRLLESPGVALHDVSDWVGHSNITTTSRYLATTGVRKQAVLGRFEAGRQTATSP